MNIGAPREINSAHPWPSPFGVTFAVQIALETPRYQAVSKIIRGATFSKEISPLRVNSIGEDSYQAYTSHLISSEQDLKTKKIIYLDYHKIAVCF